jgi:hypothetical protein
MQILTEAKQRAAQLLQENSATLLTAGGVVGVVGTGVLAWRGGMKYQEIYLDRIDELNAGLDLEDDEDREKYQTVDTISVLTKVQWAAPHIAIPLVSGGLTIAAIVMSNRMNGQRAAALAAAYGLSQRQLEEYKAKVAEKLTPKKQQEAVDELAQERVNAAPGSTQIIVVDGEVLCFDEPTGRYFKSSVEKINQAVNATNAEIHHHEFASASYFYEELGLPATTWTDEVGWNRDNLLELKFSTVLAEDNRPCVAIDFKNLPQANYVPRHF